jgi:hypothetical protein
MNLLVLAAEMQQVHDSCDDHGSAPTLLTLKFGQLPQAALDTVHAASTEHLETWITRVLTAGTLDEVLR